MAPLDQYLIPDEKAEIALARSAAPGIDFGCSGSDGAAAGWLRNCREGLEWLPLHRRAQSWGKATDDPEFWNPKMRAPH